MDDHRATSARYRVDVPYYQFDQQGVVFNMWYLAWFDSALVWFLDEVGVPYGELLEGGLDQQLVHTEIDWASGVRFGERIEIDVFAQHVGNTSFTLVFEVHRIDDAGDTVVATGRTVYVNIDGSGKAPLPPALRQALVGTFRR